MTIVSPYGPRATVPFSGAALTDVTQAPPALTNNPLVYTHLSELDTLNNLAGNNAGQPIKKFTTGISNSPDDYQYIITGDGTRDLLLDFSGDLNHKFEHVLRVDNFISVIYRGLYMAPPIMQQKYGWTGGAGGFFTPSEPYPYPKIPGGMAIRMSNRRWNWFEGCHIKLDTDYEPLNADFTVWRGENMNPASPYNDYNNSGLGFQNCLFEGNEGANPGSAGDTMYHADYCQNQSGSDPVGRYKRLVIENCNWRNGQEGFVFHGHSQGTGGVRPSIFLRNIDSNINNDNANAFDRGAGLHFPFDAVTTLATYPSDISISNVHFSRSGNWPPCIKVSNSPVRYLTDMADNGGAGGQFIGHPELHRYPNVVGTTSVHFVLANQVGGGYATPW